VRALAEIAAQASGQRNGRLSELVARRIVAWFEKYLNKESAAPAGR
jgi:hypothetical protein